MARESKNQAASLPPQPPANEASQAGFQRVYNNEVMIDSDLFVLGTEKMQKKVPLTKNEYIPIDHQHFFHSHDSDGRVQKVCTPVGNHFHEIELVYTDKGPVCKCGPPMREGGIKDPDTGEFQKGFVSFDARDCHTHNVVYIRSTKVSKRKSNLEAAKVHATISAKQDMTIPGVRG